MDTRDVLRGEARRLIELAPDRPLSLRLGAGSTVTVVEGILWCTQEGMLEDVVLRRGGTFVVANNATQVLSAVDSRALVRIADAHAQALALRHAELRSLGRRARLFVTCKIRALRKSLSREPSRRPFHPHASSS